MSSADAPITVDNIDKAPATLPAPSNTDWRARAEQLNETNVRLGDENFRLKEELSRLRQINSTRETLDNLIQPMARSSFIFMCCYCAAVASMVVFAGFSLFGFKLADEVLKLLVGSTAVTVIGLVGMVLTGIFVGARRK